MTIITSRDNPRVRRWRELTRDARQRRREKRALIEGEHLIQALLDSGRMVEELVLSKTGAAKFGTLARRSARTPVVLGDAVFKSLSDTETPAGVAAEIALPGSGAGLESSQSCVFLEGIQDAGNVGAILRSAAAFGVDHAVLGTGCADAWSPKVLRAGMGAHFGMEILEQANLVDAIAQFGGKVACTVVRGGQALKDADLAGRMGWIFGAEGQGVSDALAARAQLKVTIPMPGGAQSLNVAAAAAVCFYELSRRAAPG
ncbi:MAG TPA: RNA methyltransferase [Burkholderiales bacterium]|nr:RNA methyltransferase [Burkholderiales bacterium]